MGTRRIRRSDGEFTLFFRKVSPFSNHHPAEFVCDESINFPDDQKRFSCTEQYYMYNKACLLRDEKLMAAVLECDSPRAMKSMCSKGALRGWSDALWDRHKENVMYTGCLAKFGSCQHLRFALFLSTGSRLVECSPFDAVWGIGKDLEMAEKTALDSGRNLLGKILDRVREELWTNEIYRDEREEIEKRTEEDANYLLKAIKQIDLLYKERARKRYLISMRGNVFDADTIITAEMRELLPDWALPPPLEKDETIRPSPPQITHFPRSPIRRSRSTTPPAQPVRESRLFGRLTRSDIRPILKRELSEAGVKVRSGIDGREKETIRKENIAVGPDPRRIEKREEKKRGDWRRDGKDARDVRKKDTGKDRGRDMRKDRLRAKRAITVIGTVLILERNIAVQDDLSHVTKSHLEAANGVVDHHLPKIPIESEAC